MIDKLKDLFQIRDFFFHLVLTSSLYLVLPRLILLFYPLHSNQSYLHRHSWLLNFDSIHYFNNEYQYEPNHAFLPVYVSFVQTVKALLPGSIAIGGLLLINKIAYILAAAELQCILRNLFRGHYQSVPISEKESISKVSVEDRVRTGILFFVYNPAGIFFNTLYTESIFCFLTFKAVSYLLERQYESVSTILLAFSVGIRSNGMFLAPVIGLEILSTFFTNIKSNIYRSVSAFCKGSVIILCLLAPFVAHNIFTYYNVCKWANQPSAMCQGGPLSFYGAVQEKYWNVGFLRYFTVGNIVFIVIGTPAVLIAFLGLFYYSSTFDIRQKGLYLSFLILFLVTAFFTNIQSSTRFFCGHPFFYYILAKLSPDFPLGLVKTWSVFYWLAGILMYVVGFPWTWFVFYSAYHDCLQQTLIIITREMLRETLQQRKRHTYNTGLYSLEVFFEEECEIICKQCGYYLAPLSAATHYLNIDIEHYRFGNNFLLMDLYQYPNLVVEHQNQTFSTEDPFKYMHLKPVHCLCCQEVRGLYFQTVNIEGNQFLLDKVALNMDLIEINDKMSRKMKKIVNQLFDLLNSVQLKKAQNKVEEMKRKEQNLARSNTIESILKEKELQRVLTASTDPVMPQNKTKGRIVREIIAHLAFFDRRTERLEKQCEKVQRRCKLTKLECINHYTEIQELKLKNQRMSRENSVEKVNTFL